MIDFEKIYKYGQFIGRDKKHQYKPPFGKEKNVVNSGFRIDKANIELENYNNIYNGINYESSVKKVIDLVIEFLDSVGIASPCYNGSYIFCFSKDNLNKEIDYNDIKNKCDLNNKTHLIWMKFLQNGMLGVVAASNDINFNYNNTSGIILSKVNGSYKWNDSFVLLFPLSNITDGLRKDLECAIGNYLISKGVPILDYYSHCYQ